MRERNPDYVAEQWESFRDTFDLGNVSSSRRAVEAIARLVTGEPESVPGYIRGHGG